MLEAWEGVPRGVVERSGVGSGAAGDGSGTSSPHLEVGRQALHLLDYPWRERLPEWSVSFLPGRAGLLGGTWTYERRIEIYVREGHSVGDVAFTLAHELGHAVDVTLFGDAERSEWLAARGLHGSTPWWVESGATDFASGAGDWAEAFAVHQLGGASQTRLAGQPDDDQLALVARLGRA
jgi:hypothetical protein